MKEQVCWYQNEYKYTNTKTDKIIGTTCTDGFGTCRCGQGGLQSQHCEAKNIVLIR